MHRTQTPIRNIKLFLTTPLVLSAPLVIPAKAGIHVVQCQVLQSGMICFYHVLMLGSV